MRDPGTNEVTERRLWIDIMSSRTALPPIAKNGYNNNLKDINIPPIVPQGGRKRRQTKEQPDWKPERFAKFWDFYRTHKWVSEMGIADGKRPDDAMTRAEAFAMVHRLAEIGGIGKL